MRRLATALSVLGFLWASGATVFILTGVGYEGISTSFTLGDGVSEYVSVSLASARGVWVVALLAGVTMIAGIPLGVALFYPEGQRVTTWGAGVLLLGFSVVSGFTVGLFYVPCAAVLLIAASATGSTSALSAAPPGDDGLGRPGADLASDPGHDPA